MMQRPMAISFLAVDSLTKSPIVILKEVDGERTLPIWIGVFEAQAIASEMEGIRYPRPMTHDLLKNVIDLMEGQIIRIEVCDLRDNTYFALIYLRTADKEISIDARPSDAIALALRARVPIFVEDVVIQKSRRVDLGAKEEITTEEGKKWTEILESLDPEDFTKYKM